MNPRSEAMETPNTRSRRKREANEEEVDDGYGGTVKWGHDQKLRRMMLQATAGSKSSLQDMREGSCARPRTESLYFEEAGYNADCQICFSASTDYPQRTSQYPLRLKCQSLATPPHTLPLGQAMPPHPNPPADDRAAPTVPSPLN